MAHRDGRHQRPGRQRWLDSTNKMGGYNIRGIIFYCTICTSNDTIMVKSVVLFFYFFISLTIYHILIQIMMQKLKLLNINKAVQSCI